MIYDLKKIEDDYKQCLKCVTLDQIPTAIGAAQLEALLAIAERLEALVEAQKPRWVEFETDHGSMEVINIHHIVRVTNYGCDEGTTKLITSEMVGDEVLTVKGTLADVMAKLRGEINELPGEGEG